MRGVAITLYCLWLVSVLSHSLSDNNIGYEGMIAMSKAACHWTNLQKLFCVIVHVAMRMMVAITLGGLLTLLSMSKLVCRSTNMYM